jgi:hypothetical protein
MSKPNHSDEASFTLGDALPPGPRFEDLANCANCRYATAVNRGGEFFCRHDPPRLDPACVQGHGDVRGVWPVVFHDDLCGRYWPKEPLHHDDALVMAARASLTHEAALDAMQAAAAKRREEKHNVSTATGRKVLHVKPAKQA